MLQQVNLSKAENPLEEISKWICQSIRQGAAGNLLISASGMQTLATYGAKLAREKKGLMSYGCSTIDIRSPEKDPQYSITYRILHQDEDGDEEKNLAVLLFFTHKDTCHFSASGKLLSHTYVAV